MNYIYITNTLSLYVCLSARLFVCPSVDLFVWHLSPRLLDGFGSYLVDDIYSIGWSPSVRFFIQSKNLGTHTDFHLLYIVLSLFGETSRTMKCDISLFLDIKRELSSGNPIF